MPGVIPEHLAASLEENFPYLFESARRGVVGEIERIYSPVSRREEVEASIGKREVELVVLDVRGSVRPGDDVRVSDASPAPVPGLHTIQDDGSAVPASAEPVLVLSKDRRISQVDVLTEAWRDRRIARNLRRVRKVCYGLPRTSRRCCRCASVIERGHLLGVQHEGKPRRGGAVDVHPLDQSVDRSPDDGVYPDLLRCVVVPGHDVVGSVLDQPSIDGVLFIGGTDERLDVNDDRRIRSTRGFVGLVQGEKWGCAINAQSTAASSCATSLADRRGCKNCVRTLACEAV